MYGADIWDRQEVEIYAKIEADGASSDQKRLVQDTEVRIDASADLIRIQSDYEKVQDRNNSSGDSDENSFTLPLIHYTLKVPRTARLSITDHKSKIGVSDLGVGEGGDGAAQREENEEGTARHRARTLAVARVQGSGKFAASWLRGFSSSMTTRSCCLF